MATPPDPTPLAFLQPPAFHPDHESSTPACSDLSPPGETLPPDPGSRPGRPSLTEPEQSTIVPPWPTREYGPDGSSLLDPNETTEACKADLPQHLQTDDDRDLSRSFRHAGWHSRRVKTLRALRRCDFSDARTGRFEQCGSTAYVLKTLDPDPAYRIASNRCHDRFCVPCATDKARVVAANLLSKLPERPLRFITLTLRSNDLPLQDRLNKLYKDFAKLRGVLRRHRKTTGGIAFLEITRNEGTSQWHPHVHIIAAGDYIPQPWLRDRWLEITGDSFIVDVRLIRDRREAAAYITKYATKTLSAKVWNDHTALCEAINALSGRRTFNVFGDWVGLNLSKPPSDDVQWVYYATLPDLLRLNRSGDLEARRVLSFLTNGAPVAPLPIDLYAES